MYLSVCGQCGDTLVFLWLPVTKSSGIHLHSNRFGKKSVLYRAEMWPKWETEPCVDVT
jgi:hypothetical protein